MEILKALTPLAIPIAVVIVCITFLLGMAAVAFLGLELESGSGKLFTLKMKKSSKATDVVPVVSYVEPHAEASTLLPETVPALPHEPVPQGLEPEEKEKEEAEAQNQETFWNYLRAKTLADLDASFEPFIQSGVIADALEYWRTDYLERRAGFGADGGRDAMRELVAEQPAWAYPHAVLINWAFDDHDMEGARQHLDAGLTKTQSQQFGHVLSAGVKLIFKTEGKQAALRFACEWSRAGLTETIRAGVFVTLAEFLKEAGDLEGYRISLEFASSLQPSNDSRTFSLAYSYAETKNRWAPAIYHYQKLVSAQGEGPMARNNVGIAYADIDKAVAIQSYEAAARDGDKYASANLAHMLLEDGYVSIAQKLLDSVEDPGNAAENHASGKAAALVAKRRAEDKLKEITEVTRANVEPYKASLAAAFRSLQRGEAAPVMGWFASQDRNVIAIIEGDRALCQLRIGHLVYDGPLQNQATCFAGWMSTKGGTILTSEVGHFTLISEGDGVLRLFRWPSTAGLQHRLEAYELRQVQEVPELAPPPPPPTQGLMSNALAQALMLPSR